MMSKVFEYKDYLGSAEVDTENHVLVGRLLFIRDVITYSATQVADLEKAFQDAVDDYLGTCAELGDEPDVPCKGSFNVRVTPELHREAALLARSQGIKLNDWVSNELSEAVERISHRRVEHVHQHNHTIQVNIEHGTTSVPMNTAKRPTAWNETYATRH